MSDIATPPAIVMPEPGFHLGISELDYDALPAIRSTMLNLFKGGKTPGHVYHSIHSGGKETTPSMKIGTLLHLALLEPERWAQEIATPPTGDKRRRETKAAWVKFEAEFPASEFHYVDADTFAKVSAMAESLRQHETAGALLSGRGQNEVTVIWRDEETGLDCKARLDRVTELNEWSAIIVDVKSTRDATTSEFNRTIGKYGYHLQAAHYLAGAEAIHPIPTGAPYRRHLLALVENVPPYLAAVREIDDASLEEGRRRRSKYMRKIKACLESGSWHGFPVGIDDCGLQPWEFKEWVDED